MRRGTGLKSFMLHTVPAAVGQKELNSEEWLRRRAAAIRKRAATVMARAKAEADNLLEDAARLEQTADQFKAVRGKGRSAGEQGAAYREHPVWTGRSQTSSVNSGMLTPEHQLAISKGKSQGKDTDALVRASQKQGMSLRALSRELEQRLGRPIPVSRLSMARRGLRPIDGDVANAIADLTGFEASARNWPGGIA